MEFNNDHNKQVTEMLFSQQKYWSVQSFSFLQCYRHQKPLALKKSKEKPETQQTLLTTAVHFFRFIKISKLRLAEEYAKNIPSVSPEDVSYYSIPWSTIMLNS